MAAETHRCSSQGQLVFSRTDSLLKVAYYYQGQVLFYRSDALLKVRWSFQGQPSEEYAKPCHRQTDVATGSTKCILSMRGTFIFRDYGYIYLF